MSGPAEAALGRAAAAKRERLGHAVEQVDRALFRLGRQGFARLSPAAVAELRALAQTAHHAGMVKVERELEALATQAERYLERDPLYDDRRALGVVNRIWLLNQAARQAFASGQDPAQLTEALGALRRRYDPAPGPIAVQALGAQGWVTDSDFVGVTVTLRAGDRLLQISNARPCVLFGREPLRLLGIPISDALGLSVQDLSHGAFILEDARVSADGRVSVHAGLGVHPAPWQGAAYAGRTASTWDALVDLLRAHDAHPIAPSGGVMALVEPAGWGPVEVDEVQGAASLALTDRAGARLLARVPLRPENNLLVDNLQRLAARAGLRPPALFGRVSAGGRGLFFEPWSAVYGAPVVLRASRAERRVNEVHLGLEDLDRVRIERAG